MNPENRQHNWGSKHTTAIWKRKRQLEKKHKIQQNPGFYWCRWPVHVCWYI